MHEAVQEILLWAFLAPLAAVFGAIKVITFRP